MMLSFIQNSAQNIKISIRYQDLIFNSLTFRVFIGTNLSTNKQMANTGVCPYVKFVLFLFNIQIAPDEIAGLFIFIVHFLFLQ